MRAIYQVTTRYRIWGSERVKVATYTSDVAVFAMAAAYDELRDQLGGDVEVRFQHARVKTHLWPRQKES